MEDIALNKIVKKREKLGDIYEIPLPNGKNAYARVFIEGVGIYNIFCNSIEELPINAEYMYHLGLYKYSRRELSIVGHRAFDCYEDAWPPPHCAIDGVTKEGSLYYKGEFISCSYAECCNLEIACVWDLKQLVDRLMGDDRWVPKGPIRVDKE